MGYLDIFLIIVFGLGAIKGYVKGLVVEIFSFISFFAGLFISVELTTPVSKAIFEGSSYFQILTVAVFVVLFLIVIVITNLIAKIIKKALDLTFLGLFDNILGSLAAIFKWAFMLSMVIWVMDSVGLQLPTEWRTGSFLYNYIEGLGPVVFNWLADLLPFIKDMIDSLENIGDNKTPSFYLFRLDFSFFD